MPFKTIPFVVAFFIQTWVQLVGFEKKKNLIFALTVDHAVHCFGLYDKPISTINPTPFLDQLGTKGILFRNAFSTLGSFNPTPATFLVKGFDAGKAVSSEPGSNSFAFNFQKQGYQTAYFGPWEWQISPRDAGFEYWELLERSDIFFNPVLKSPFSEITFEGHTTDVLTDRCFEWLEKSDPEIPFFIFLSFNGTSRPWMPPIRYINQFDGEWLEIPENFFTSFADNAAASRYQKMNIQSDLHQYADLFFPSTESGEYPGIYQSNLQRMNEEQASAWRISWVPKNEAFTRESPKDDSLSTWKFQRFAKNYLRCIRAIDENCERLSNYLISSERKDTYLAYTAKSGRFLGEKGWYGKRWMYEQVLKVPLLIAELTSRPTVPLVHVPNVVNTDFLELVSPITQDNNSSIDKIGSDLQKIDRTSIYFSHLDAQNKENVCPHIGLRTDNFKLIHFFPFDEWEFFDLSMDPLEEQNEYNNPLYQAVLTKMKGYLETFNKSLGTKYTNPANFSEEWKRSQRVTENQTR